MNWNIARVRSARRRKVLVLAAGDAKADEPRCARGPAYLRALCRPPALDMTGVYALPLQLFAFVFAASNVAFLAGMLASPSLALGATTIVAVSAWILFHRAERSAETRRLAIRLWAVALPVALLLCLLGGEGRLFYANLDWQVRDAVLADLSTRPWPVHYASIHQTATVLRAPLGFYLLPSLLGRALGLPAANFALLIQDTVLLAGVLVIFMAKARTLASRLLIAAMFVTFGGWDLIGTMVVGRHMVVPGASAFAPRLEWWAYPFQYSSLITDLFWAPNHALPAWAMVAAYTAWRSGACASLQLAALLGLTLLWSPLIVMGALPFVLLALLTDLCRRRMGPLAPAALVPLVASLLPVAIYLTLDGGKVAHGLNPGSGDFLPLYGRFALIEICPLLLLGFIWSGSQDEKTRFDFLVCASLLLSIPLYRIGGSNDFAMRASIFPISLLFVIVSQGLTSLRYSENRVRVLTSLLILTYGAACPATEFARALLTPVNPATGASLLATMGESSSNNYINAYFVDRSTYEANGDLFRAPVEKAEPRLAHAFAPETQSLLVRQH
jgi:hypothetical protein